MSIHTPPNKLHLIFDPNSDIPWKNSKSPDKTIFFSFYLNAPSFVIYEWPYKDCGQRKTSLHYLIPPTFLNRSSYILWQFLKKVIISEKSVSSRNMHSEFSFLFAYNKLLLEKVEMYTNISHTVILPDWTLEKWALSSFTS